MASEGKLRSATALLEASTAFSFSLHSFYDLDMPSKVVPSAQGDESDSLVATVRALEKKIAENGGSWRDTVFGFTSLLWLPFAPFTASWGKILLHTMAEDESELLDMLNSQSTFISLYRLAYTRWGGQCKRVELASQIAQMIYTISGPFNMMGIIVVYSSYTLVASAPQHRRTRSCSPTRDWPHLATPWDHRHSSCSP